MKREILSNSLLKFSLATLVVLIGPAKTPAQWRAEQIAVVKDFDVPECVLFDPAASRVYVSNISAKPDEYWTDDGKGFISLLAADGTVKNLRWLDSTPDSPINAPKGMCVANGFLYFTDNARLMRYAITKDGKPGKLEQIALPASENLNDLATDDRTVLVSDTKLGKIYCVECSGGSVREIAALPGANGVTFHKKKMFAVSWTLHEIYELDPAGRNAPQPFGLASHFKNLDGIEVLNDGTFLVSDFMGNKLSVIAPDRKAVRTLLEIESPADIGLDRKHGVLYVPQFMKNKIVTYRLEKR